MTVNSTINRVEYAGDGSSTVFTVGFYFLADADLKVYQRDASDNEALLTITTHYTVADAGNPAGGSVAMVAAPAVGEKLVIVRDPALTQLTDYQANDAFPAETHERALDKLTMQIQRLSEQLERTIRLAETDTASSLTLPSNRAGTLLGFDSNSDMEAVSKATLQGATLPGSPLDGTLLRSDGTDGAAWQSTPIIVDDQGNMLLSLVTGAIVIPRGTTAQRPVLLLDGAMRYNSTLDEIEFETIVDGWRNLVTNAKGYLWDGGQRLKTQGPAYAASFTGDLSAGQRIEMADITAALTVNAFTNCDVGEPFLLILTMDGTGGHGVTLNAAFLNQPAVFVSAANKRMFIWGEVTAVTAGTMTEAIITATWIEP